MIENVLKLQKISKLLRVKIFESLIYPNSSPIVPNGSLSNNLFYIIFYLDTYTRKISNIRFSGTSF
jgi:hypothetical protein